jgi:hypothetical protein
MLGRLFLIASMIGAALVIRATRSFACAVCLSGDGDAVTEGYNASVLFLMATPYLVVASVAAGLIFTYRRALKRNQRADEEPLLLQEDGSR